MNFLRPLSTLVDLALPVLCVACGGAGDWWCSQCRPPAAVTHRQVAGLEITTAASYIGGVRAAMLAFKERGLHVLAPLLASYLWLALASHLEPGQRHLLVPVPSRARVARERGGNQVERLIRNLPTASGALWARPGQWSQVRPLWIRAEVQDSATLGAHARRLNLDGAFASRVARPAERDLPVVIVDDVVTTGSTVSEAARALGQAGWTVRGAVAVASTPLRSAGFATPSPPRGISAAPQPEARPLGCGGKKNSVSGDS